MSTTCSVHHILPLDYYGLLCWLCLPSGVIKCQNFYFSVQGLWLLNLQSMSTTCSVQHLLSLDYNRPPDSVQPVPYTTEVLLYSTLSYANALLCLEAALLALLLLYAITSASQKSATALYWHHDQLTLDYCYCLWPSMSIFELHCWIHTFHLHCHYIYPLMAPLGPLHCPAQLGAIHFNVSCWNLLIPFLSPNQPP